MRRLGRAFAIAFAVLVGAWAIDFAWLYGARATITSTASTVVGLGNGTTSVFAFPFVGVAASDISVVYTDTAGTRTTLDPTTYTLTFTPPSPGQLWGLGGTVTYPLTGSPIATGTTLSIIRTLPLTQTTSSNQGQRFALAIEAALDVLEMQIQQVAGLIGRAITVPVGDTCTIPLTALPPATQRANQMIGFDSTGCNPIALQPTGAPVSAAMQPVVDAPDIATALSLLGITVSNLPVGAEMDWPGLSAPSMWKLENGAAIDRTTYSALLAVIAPVVSCTISMGSSTITGISSTVGWAPGWIIEAPGALVAGQTIATVSTNSITIAGGAATANATSCQIFPYGTAQDGTFNLPNAAGVVYAGLDTGNANLNATYCTGNPARLNAACGAQSRTLVTGNLPAYTPAGSLALTVTDPGHRHGFASPVYVDAGSSFFTASGGVAGTTITQTSLATTGVTVTGTFTGAAQGGASTPFSTLQPTRLRNKIIFAGAP